MAELGLTYVRIGEFAWSRLEPRDGELNFDWLDRALDIGFFFRDRLIHA